MKIRFKNILGLLALSLTLPCAAETITGNRTISADYAPTDNFLIVGTTSAAGNLSITGGTTALSGGTNVAFRSQQAGLLIVNGTVSVSNATVNASSKGVYANAPAGCSASLIINNGGKVISAGYPGIGGDFGTTGNMTINAGGTFESNKSFYCAGQGVGTVNLNGGTLKVVANGLHIGRDYEPGQGACEGTFNMSSGNLNVDKYLIIGRNNPGTTHVNKGVFNMTGGTATIGDFFTVGNSTSNTDMIQCTANISGSSVMTVGGVFNIGNAESSTSIGTATSPSTMTLSDSASVTVSGSFIGIGSKGTLNLAGGTFTNNGTGSLVNAGTLNLVGGSLVSAATATKLENTGVMNAQAGSLTSAVALTNTGTLNFNGPGATLNAAIQNNGTANISEGNPVFNECVTIGTAAAAGELNITGGTTTFNGAVPGTFRDDVVGLRISNGKVTITNATVNTSGEAAIFVDGVAGGTAELVIGKGAVVTSNASHPSAGAEAGTTGIITIDGGQFLTTESMYVGGNGIGYLNVNSGYLQVKGLQVARDYQNATYPASGNCEGYVNITGGEVKATSYFIISHDNKAGSTHPTYVEFNMSGSGKASTGLYFCLADNSSNYADQSMVQGVANFHDQSTLTVGTNLGIGNGEDKGNVNSIGGQATFNVYDKATITAANGFTGIGSASSLNLYGGEMTVKNLGSKGTITMTGGKLAVTGSLTNNTGASIDFVNGLKGFGSMTVGSNLTNSGTVDVSTGSGLGLINGYDATNGMKLIDVTGTTTNTGTITKDASIGSADFSSGDLIVKLAGNAAGTMSATNGSITLDSTAASGWINLTDFTSSNPYIVSLSFNGMNASNQEAIRALLADDLQLGDEDFMTVVKGASENSLVVKGLSGDLFSANVLTWNFLDPSYSAYNLSLSGIGMKEVPEPSTLALLALGLLFGFLGLRKRSR